MLDISSNSRGNQVYSGRDSTNYNEPKIAGLGKTKKTNLTTLFTLIALSLFVIMVVFLFAYKLNRQAELETKDEAFSRLNVELKTKVMTEIANKAERLDKGLAEVNKFLAKRPLFFILVSELKSITPSEVKYSNLTVDEKSNAKIIGETSNYNNVANLLALMKNSDKFSNIGLTSATSMVSQDGGNKVAFSISTQIVSNELITTSQTIKNTSNSKNKIETGEEVK